MKFKIIFHMDGTGVYYDSREPIHFDALLAWCLASRLGLLNDLTRTETPADIPLPLMKKHFGSEWVYCASALFPEGGEFDGLQYNRKRFRQEYAELCSGSICLVAGPYKDRNIPIPLVMAPRMVAYANGNRKECKNILRELKYLGKYRTHGFGKIINIEFEQMEMDYSLVCNGKSMRYIPKQDGTRIVRPRPPYWNRVGCVPCADIGQLIF